MNHTPGWNVQQLEDAHNSYADWPTFAIRDNITNVCLALVGTVDHYDSEHNPDRARLIAAAPELLEALKGYNLIDYTLLLSDALILNTEPRVAEILEKLAAAIQQVRPIATQAISKAEGKDIQ